MNTLYSNVKFVILCEKGISTPSLTILKARSISIIQLDHKNGDTSSYRRFLTHFTSGEEREELPLALPPIVRVQ